MKKDDIVLLSPPLSVSYTQDEMLAKAQEWMFETYGPPKETDVESRGQWYERFGMLCDFVISTHPRKLNDVTK